MTTARERDSGNYDDLTGVLNYQGFQLVTEHVIARSARNHEPVTLVCFQVSSVAWRRSTGARLARNATLAELSWLVRSNVRASDIVARSNESELAILLPDTDAAQAAIVVNGCITLVSREQSTVHPSSIVRVGYSTFDPTWDPCDLEVMLNTARLEMHATPTRWYAPNA
jgi:diguanylate cyclase (GGDEF)-like protein